MVGVPTLVSFVVTPGNGGSDPPWTAASSSAAAAAAMEYALLSLANGVAFTSYNLASTYVLMRVSVVHHAALNCVRHVFAIIVTSLIFGSTITSLQVAGMTIAVFGFFSYVHFKLRKETRDGRRMELRRKYGGVIMTKATTTDGTKMRNGGARWRTGHCRSMSSSSTSFFPMNNPAQ